MKMSNPLYGQPWSEREYLVALHYYFLHRSSPIDRESDFVVEVATLLGRTPSAVAMRMENFANLDREAKRLHKGLSNGGPMCRRIFLNWKDRPDHLKSCAEVWIRELAEPEPLSLFETEPVKLPRGFQHYELFDQLGEGGFATVFSCIHKETNEWCALKILKTLQRFDPEVLHRFKREMRVLRSVQHENVIKLLEDNLSETIFPVFVMELAQCSLTAYMDELKEQPGSVRPYIPTPQAAQIFRSMATALDTLHHQEPRKIIHRDLNPNNILLLPDGRWVLADFGLAKFLPSAAIASSFATYTGRGYGTQYYAAPEQYSNFRHTDERTDIYALGMLLWDLFTTGSGYPEKLRPMLPKPIKAIFCRAVADDHTARYESARAMLNEFNETVPQLEEFLKSRAPSDLESNARARTKSTGRHQERTASSSAAPTTR
jgi:serine/threonine protein kinase